MDRYKNGKIYKIVDNTNGNIYIGSTCVPTLSIRLAKHRYHYKEYLEGGGNFITSFKVLENDDYDIILLEDFPCETKDQLLAKERYYIENNDCVNKKIPLRTIKEYREDNKNQLREQKKIYYQNNKDKLREYKKKYRKENKDKLQDYQKKYRENKKNNDVIYNEV